MSPRNDACREWTLLWRTGNHASIEIKMMGVAGKESSKRFSADNRYDIFLNLAKKKHWPVINFAIAGSLPHLDSAMPDVLTTVSEHTCYGGVQSFYIHTSASVRSPMRFSVFRPAQSKNGPVPVLIYLAGLTCTEETFPMKAGAQRIAAELGLMLVSPDTSPRNTGVPDEAKDWDLGAGAGFYLNATVKPWLGHYRMEDYVVNELRRIIDTQLGGDVNRLGLFGHSMGGHGALTLALRHPGLFKSLSAFAPICAASQCPWGTKAFSNYLGADTSTWQSHDACCLIAQAGKLPYPDGILVDQGLGDKFLIEQLKPELLEHSFADVGQPLTLRRHAGFDHGYYFIQTFMEDHLRFHYERLTA
jgi:S-formylglutathione hydrolase